MRHENKIHHVQLSDLNLSNASFMRILHFEGKVPANDDKPEGENKPPPEKKVTTAHRNRSALATLATSLVIGMSAFLAGRMSVKPDTHKPADPEAVTKLVSKNYEFLRILSSVDDALNFSRKKQFKQEVVELENTISGSYTYIFRFVHGPEDTNAIVLRGIRAGEERERLLSSLKPLGYRISAGMSASSEMAPPKSPAELARSIASITLTTLIAGYLGYELLRMRKLSASDKLSQKPSERFKDIGGLGHVVEELQEVADGIQKAMKGDEKVKLPKGMLLVGSPGTGKTLSARAIAGEVECEFLCISSGDLASSRWAGEWAKSVLRTFTHARRIRDMETKKLRSKPGATGKEQAVVIIFLDEFDSIGFRRDDSTDGMTPVHQEQRKMLNALLAEMDHIDPLRNKNILIVGATNALKVLDQALLRPGRFAKIIELPEPRSTEQRLDILQKLSARLLEDRQQTFENPDCLKYLAAISDGNSGDELRDILQQASDLASKESSSAIKDEHLLEAFQRRHFGRVEKDAMPPSKRALVACHEHGHALGALACGIQPFLVSMKPRGSSGGRVMVSPDSIPHSPISLLEILRSVLYTAGGRAAEMERYPGEFTDGAAADLKQIRQMVRHAISQGMIGEHYALDLSELKPEYTPAEIVTEMNQITARALETARRIIAVIGKDTLQTLMDDSLKMDQELIGQEAVKFYESRIEASKLEEMKRIAAEFFAAPTTPLAKAA